MTTAFGPDLVVVVKGMRKHIWIIVNLYSSSQDGHASTVTDFQATFETNLSFIWALDQYWNRISASPSLQDANEF